MVSHLSLTHRGRASYSLAGGLLFSAVVVPAQAVLVDRCCGAERPTAVTQMAQPEPGPSIRPATLIMVCRKSTLDNCPTHGQSSIDKKRARMTHHLFKRFQLGLIGIGVATGCALTGGVYAAPASSATTIASYPTGCNKYVQASWGATCWTGRQYANSGTAVLGEQYILRSLSLTSSAADCWFGALTESGVTSFQRRHGLVQDGVVGTHTYTAFYDEVTYSGVNDDYGSYWNTHGDGMRFYWESGLGGTWFVLDPYYYKGTDYVAMSTVGASSSFCPA